MRQDLLVNERNKSVSVEETKSNLVLHLHIGQDVTQHLIITISFPGARNICMGLLHHSQQVDKAGQEHLDRKKGSYLANVWVDYCTCYSKGSVSKEWRCSDLPVTVGAQRCING